MDFQDLKNIEIQLPNQEWQKIYTDTSFGDEFFGGQTFNKAHVIKTLENLGGYVTPKQNEPGVYRIDPPTLYNFVEDGLFYEELKTGPNVVLIIESPHKKEYTSRGTAIFAAQGKTGENIENYIDKVVKDNFGIISNYNLYVFNRVPVQTSLGTYNTTLGGGAIWEVRNYIFNTLSPHYEPELFRLIKEIEPDYIIEASTKLDLKGKEKAYFQQRLKNQFRGATIKTTVHPCNWDKLPKIVLRSV